MYSSEESTTVQNDALQLILVVATECGQFLEETINQLNKDSTNSFKLKDAYFTKTKSKTHRHM